MLGTNAFAQTTTQQGLSNDASTSATKPKTTATKAPYTLPDTVSPQSHPAPTAAPSDGHLQFNGKARVYDFQRLNRVQNAANPNRHAIEFAIEPHFGYRLGNTPLILGYTYGGATPFGFNGPQPEFNPHVDNTLPGFPLDQTIHEAYLQYKDKNNNFVVGDQELNYPWTPNSDSRVLPVSYQGVDASVKLSKTLTVGATRIVRWEARNSSGFSANTLLTAPYPGASSLIANSNTITPGTLRLALTYQPVQRLNIKAEDYQFFNIANLTYSELKYGISPTSFHNPYLAIQYVAENSLGKNQIGRINNHTIGAQIGVNPVKNLLFAGSVDSSPVEYATVRAASAAAAAAGYFVGGGGTGTTAALGNGLYRVAYGGLASPYTDSLGTDPLYTTQITQGMADRRSAGNSYKAALVYTATNKQYKLLASEGWYQYSNSISRNLTSEFNLDGTYFFNRVRPGAYKGFFVRVRLAPRTQPTLPYNFTYQRFITEYDF